MKPTRVLTNPDDILAALSGQPTVAFRITDDGIVSEIQFLNGARVTGAMLVEGPDDNTDDKKEKQ